MKRPVALILTIAIFAAMLLSACTAAIKESAPPTTTPSSASMPSTNPTPAPSPTPRVLLDYSDCAEYVRYDPTDESTIGTTYHWAAKYMQPLIDAGIIVGYNDGSVRPDDTITRAEFLTMMVRVLNDSPLPSPNDGEFWWQPMYDYASNEGWLGVYPEAFIPADTKYLDSSIYRHEVAEILYNRYGFPPPSIVMDVEFIDEIDYYVPAVVRMGFMDGYPDGTFRQYNTLTRAEAATVIYRVYRMRSLPEGFEYVTRWGDEWLLQSADRYGTELRLVNIVTDEILDSHYVEMDVADLDEKAKPSPLEQVIEGFDYVQSYIISNDVLRTLGGRLGNYVWGEAGLWRYEGGRLVCLHEDGVAASKYEYAQTVCEDGDGLLFLTHIAGERTHYGTGYQGQRTTLGGDILMRLNADNSTAVLLPHKDDSLLCFIKVFREEDGRIYLVGPEHLLYRLEDGGRLTALPTEGGEGYNARTPEEAASSTR